MDRLDELAVLVAILDGGSLAAGARGTRRSAAAVTRILRELEKRIGVRLVDRNTRRMAPTRAGRELAGHARKLLAQYEDAVREVVVETVEERGALRVSAPLAFGQRHLAPVIARFLEAHPKVTVDLALADPIIDLFEQGVDVALRIGRLADSGLVARTVGRIRRIVVASPEYLKRRGEPRTPAELAQHEMIVQARSTGVVEWPFTMARRGVVRIRPRGRLLVSSADAAIAAACAGGGLIMPNSYQVAERVKSGDLVRVLRDFDPPLVPVSVVYKDARLVPSRVRAFVEFSARALKAVDQSGWA